MTNIERMKDKLWNVPQFVLEQKDAWTDKQERYNRGVIRDRFHISDEVGRFDDWRVNGQVGDRPIGKNQPQSFTLPKINWRVRDGLNPQFGKAILWIVSAIMLVILLTDAMGLAVIDSELWQINAQIETIRKNRGTIDDELNSQLATHYIAQAAQLNNVSVSSNTYVLHVPEEATMPIEIAESDISRESLAVIYGD